jgi:hypothetical protein
MVLTLHWTVEEYGKSLYLSVSNLSYYCVKVKGSSSKAIDSIIPITVTLHQRDEMPCERDGEM